jgi:hypothetical protein
MIITRNYFVIPNKLFNHLFTENFGDLYGNKQNQVIFIRGFEVGSNVRYLNYYSFNILLNQTKDQNTIFHTLTDNFFNELSVHKNKLILSGQILTHANEEFISFTPTKIIYLYPYKKLGIYVRKKIISKFTECGIDIVLDKKQHDGNISMFTLQ